MQNRFFKKIFAFIAVCIVLISYVLPTAMYKSAGSTISNEAEEHILSQLRSARIPNAAIAIIQDGETSYILKDSSYDTLFQTASVSKSFTGFGVLLLEDMGLLSINDPVNLHLPWFEVKYRGVPVSHEDITIYNLLHHTSGLTSNEGRFPRAAATETTDEFISRLTGIELAFYPSTRFVYGNINYVILGLIIEAVSGQSYDEYMTQHVLHPLNLYNTFTDQERAHETGRVAGGHNRGFLQIIPHESRAVHPTHIPTGGIYSSIADLARWAGIHLGVIDIPEQLSRVAQRSHIHHHAFDAPFTDAGNFYAAGWRIDLENSFIEHSGQYPGYSATIRMFPQSNTAVVVLSSLRYGSMERLGELALDAVENGNFINRGFDFFEIIDMVFTILTVVGIVYAVMLIRLFIKLYKRLRSGERIGGNFSSITIKGLIDPIISIAIVIAVYIVGPAIFDTTIGMMLLNWPVSLTTAIIGLWVSTVYSLCSWFAKTFVQKGA